MADILTPSPPALGDSHLALSGSTPLPPPERFSTPGSNVPPTVVATETPKPKSSLYSDKALAPVATSPSSAQKPAQAPQAPTQRDATPLDVSSEPGLTRQPDPHPGPNLYPSVRVAANDEDQAHSVTTETPPAPQAGENDPHPPLPDQQTHVARGRPPTPPPKPGSPPGAWKGVPPSPPPKPMPPQPSLEVVSPPSPSLPMIQEPELASPPALPPYNPRPRPALDSLSYLESASMMSGTLESLSGLGEDGSSLGSDSEVNGLVVRRTDKYGFLGGTQFSESGEKEVRVEVARQREMKWLEMFKLWDKWVKHQFPKVKMRCRKGIPSSLRARAWQLLSNSEELLLANPGKFEELEREPGEAKWLDIIEKDLHRQFPFHEMFAARGGHGQQDLYRILKAYTVYRPDEGYCQAQAPVAAVLLMHMPAEHAFWCLVQICEKYLPGYYSAGLEAIQLDGEIFFSLLRRTCPMAYRHLKKFKIDPILYMTEWFMCIFSRTLPWACVLRVWDMFFCEGVKIVFRVGLVLLKQMLGSVDKLRELQGMYETMERLRNISPDMIREDVLVQEVVSMPVTEALLERESSIQVRKWREARGALGHQPARRLHGTRAVFELKRRAAAISSGGSFSFLGVGSSAPPPGPLRASSSLLSLQGFRKARGPFMMPKKSSFSGPCPAADSITPNNVSNPRITGKPPRATALQIQSPLVVASAGAPAGPPQSPPPQSPLPQDLKPKSPLLQDLPSQSPPPQSPLPQDLQPLGSPPQSLPPSNTLTPVSKTVSEHITPTLPSPTANNVPLPPCPPPAPTSTTTVGEVEEKDEKESQKKKNKRSKEDKRKEREEEKQRLRERKERERQEKEREKRDKERLEKERKKEKAGKRKDRGGGGVAAAAPREPV